MSDPTEAPTCPRCGDVLPPYAGRGRRRAWCSDECRRRARDERLAAEGVSVAVRLDWQRIAQLEADLARTRAQLRATRKDLGEALQRAEKAERRVQKDAAERARLVENDRAYRAYLRGLPAYYRDYLQRTGEGRARW